MAFAIVFATKQESSRTVRNAYCLYVYFEPGIYLFAFHLSDHFYAICFDFWAAQIRETLIAIYLSGLAFDS